MTKRVRSTALITMSLPFILSGFQNCSNPMRSTGASSAAPGSSTIEVSSRFLSMSSSNELVAKISSTQDQVNILKTRGCMFDALVLPEGSDYADNLQMLKRSQCAYLQRVVETWALPPDFEFTKKKLKEIRDITGKNFIFGIFIAEAISTTAAYKDDSGQPFNFPAMCAPNTLGQWGADTCVPSTASNEYIRYLRYVVGKSMDAGLRDILFGQLGHLDRARIMPSLLAEFREMARQRGIVVAFGGQPNGIMPETYLKQFDYIISPAYIDHDRSQKCLPGTNCQAVLFHPEIVGMANNVIAEIDWSSLDDDMHRLGRKSRIERHRYLYELSQELKARSVGFVLPFRIWYDGGAAGACQGINQYVYSASNSFDCKDEDAWNAIMLGQNPVNTVNRQACVFNGSSVSHGASVMAYVNPNADVGACVAHMRTCDDGRLSGSAVHGSCVETAKAVPPPVNHEPFVTERYMTIFKRQASPEEIQFWVKGIQSGAYTYDYISAHFAAVCASGKETCGRIAKKTCSFDGRSIEHGASVMAYASPVLPDGSLCQPVSRICNDGSLSGATSAVYGSCRVNPPLVLTEEEFLRVAYRNILMREPDAGGLAFWAAEIRAGRFTRHTVQEYFYRECQSGRERCGH